MGTSPSLDQFRDEAALGPVSVSFPPPRSPRPGPVTVVVLTGRPACAVASGLAADLFDLAASAFAGPPWHETAEHARGLTDRMLADAEHVTFALSFAFTGDGPGLAGFSYGVRRRPTPGSPADHLVSSRGEPFEFCELAVRPAARGRGAGRALHDAVLAASGPQPRWLITHPAARPAVSLYQASGWRTRRLVPSMTDGSPRMLMTRSR